MVKGQTDKIGTYTLIASVVSSAMVSILFLALALLKNSGRPEPLYSQVDIIAGMIFVFILSMIVSASVWPAIVERRRKGEG